MASDSQIFADTLKQVGAAISINTTENTNGETWIQELKEEMEETARMINRSEEKRHDGNGKSKDSKRPFDKVAQERDETFRTGVLALIDEVLSDKGQRQSPKRRKIARDAASLVREPSTLAPSQQAMQTLATISTGLNDLIDSSTKLLATYETAEKSLVSETEIVTDAAAMTQREAEEASEQGRLKREKEYRWVEEILRTELVGSDSAWTRTWERLERAVGRAEKTVSKRQKAELSSTHGVRRR